VLRFSQHASIRDSDCILFDASAANSSDLCDTCTQFQVIKSENQSWTAPVAPNKSLQIQRPDLHFGIFFLLQASTLRFPRRFHAFNSAATLYKESSSFKKETCQMRDRILLGKGFFLAVLTTREF
jgi:hypothetical protein